jgi:hypothetical protein
MHLLVAALLFMFFMHKWPKRTILTIYYLFLTWVFLGWFVTGAHKEEFYFVAIAAIPMIVGLVIVPFWRFCGAEIMRREPPVAKKPRSRVITVIGITLIVLLISPLFLAPLLGW